MNILNSLCSWMSVHDVEYNAALPQLLFPPHHPFADERILPYYQHSQWFFYADTLKTINIELHIRSKGSFRMRMYASYCEWLLKRTLAICKITFKCCAIPTFFTSSTSSKSLQLYLRRSYFSHFSESALLLHNVRVHKCLWCTNQPTVNIITTDYHNAPFLYLMSYDSNKL